MKELKPVVTLRIEGGKMAVTELKEPESCWPKECKEEGKPSKFEGSRWVCSCKSDETRFNESFVPVGNPDYLKPPLTNGLYDISYRGMVFEVTCKWNGNRESCANETCWDLYHSEGCQKNPSIAIVTLPQTVKDYEKQSLEKYMGIKNVTLPDKKEREQLLSEVMKTDQEHGMYDDKKEGVSEPRTYSEDELREAMRYASSHLATLNGINKYIEALNTKPL